jgi:hypothetical protein
MPSHQTCAPENRLPFFPRTRRPRSAGYAKNASLAAFKCPCSNPPSSSPPPNEEPKTWAALFPAWMRRSASWLANNFRINTAEDEPIMSGASSDSGTPFRYDEDALDFENLCDEQSTGENIEARIIELGLS